MMYELMMVFALVCPLDLAVIQFLIFVAILTFVVMELILYFVKYSLMFAFAPASECLLTLVVI